MAGADTDTDRWQQAALRAREARDAARERAIRHDGSTQDLAALAAAAQGGDREAVVVAAWETLATGLGRLDGVLACDPAPEQALVAMLADPAGRAQRLRGRDVRARVCAAVCRSEFCTTEAVLRLPVTVLGPDLPAGSEEQVAGVVAAQLGENRAAWEALVLRGQAVGVDAWRPLGELLSVLARTTTRSDDDDEPASVEALTAHGFPDAAARAWAKTGLGVAHVSQWAAVGLKPGNATLVARLGARTAEEASWAADLTGPQLRGYLAAKLSYPDAVRLRRDGICGAEAGAYAEAGVTGTRRILAYHDAGVTGPDAVVFTRAGATTLTAVRRLLSRGVTATWIRDLRGYRLEEMEALAAVVSHPMDLGWDLPHMDVSVVTGLVGKGIDPRWAVVLHHAGLLTKGFVHRHRAALTATRPPFVVHRWESPSAEEVLATLEAAQ